MSERRAVLCALSAFFLWVIVDAIIKFASQATLSPFLIVGGLGLVSAASIGITGLAQRDLSFLVPTRPLRHAQVCICSLILNYACVIALKHLSLTLYYIIAFTGPLMIAATVSFLKHEELTRQKVVCLSIGFLGVVIAVGLHHDLQGEWIGVMFAFIAVICFTAYSVIIRSLSKTDSARGIQFYSTLVNGLMGTVAAAIQGTGVPEGKALGLLAIGGLINLVGNFLYSSALRHTTSTNVAQTHYTQIVSGGVIAYVVWSEQPTWNLLVGSCLIIAAGLWVLAQTPDLKDR